MYSLALDQQSFLVDLLPLSPPTQKATKTQCDEGGSRLALKLSIAEYHMAESKP